VFLTMQTSLNMERKRISDEQGAENKYEEYVYSNFRAVVVIELTLRADQGLSHV
jgi:hypothetical protein